MRNMIKFTVIILTLSILLTANISFAQEKKVDYSKIIGKWESVRETPRGTMTTVFSFELKDGKLTGKSTMRRGDIDLKNIKFDGENLSFEMEFGRGDRTFSMAVKAKVKGDKLEGTMENPRGENEFTATKVKEKEKEK